MPRIHWEPGTGRYIDPDKTTYVVVGEDGQAFWVLAVGNPLGHNKEVVQTSDGLVIRSKKFLSDSTDLTPEVRLVHDLTGFWDVSAQEVFRDELTGQERPEKGKKGKKQKSEQPKQPDVGDEDHASADLPAEDEPAEEVAERLPSINLDELVEQYIGRYRVFRGVGGVTALIASDGYVCTARSGRIVKHLENKVKDPAQRAEFWRLLRVRSEVGELTEIPILSPVAGSYVASEPQLGEGWFLCEPGRPPRHVADYVGFARLDTASQLEHGSDMGINTTLARVTRWVGYIGQPGSVYGPIKGMSGTTVLALCPIGTTCTFDAVLVTTDGYRVVRYSVSRIGRETRLHKPRETREYIVGIGHKDRVRVYMRPKV